MCMSVCMSLCVCAFCNSHLHKNDQPSQFQLGKEGNVIYRYKKSNFQPKRDLDIHLTLLYDFVNKRCKFVV